MPENEGVLLVGLMGRGGGVPNCATKPQKYVVTYSSDLKLIQSVNGNARNQ